MPDEPLKIEVPCPDCGQILKAELLLPEGTFAFETSPHEECTPRRILATLQVAAAVLHRHWSL